MIFDNVEYGKGCAGGVGCSSKRQRTQRILRNQKFGFRDLDGCLACLYHGSLDERFRENQDALVLGRSSLMGVSSPVFRDWVGDAY